ncbi:MAG: single-stranded DNA-binding protein [Erysipelotrichaceae bacterium]|nr:single-stranded DNA-binding protein [Erysipelotrichaceae bacterium]
MGLNKAILIGRLTRDPEVRYTQSNRAVAQFTLAIDRPFTNQETGEREADFLNIVIWDKPAENVGKYTHKGSQVAVEGRIQTRNYENNEGKKVYVTEIIASRVQFLDSKKDDSKFESMPEPPISQESTNQQEENDPFEAIAESIENEMDSLELPF